MASPASWRRTSTTWWRVPTASRRSTGFAAPLSRVSGSARIIWRSGTSRSTGGARSRSRSSRRPTDRRSLRSAACELRRRLSDAVDDRLPLARFLRPHLVEDEVAVRVSDEVAVVDLDRLHPVRVVADDEVGTVVDREVADLSRVVGGDAGSGNREQFVLLAPVKAHHDDVGLRADEVDLSLQLGPVDMGANPIESEKGEVDAADLADLVEAQPGHANAVLGQEDLRLVGARRAEIRP